MTQKILIIEDDKSVQQLIRMYLVNDGFEVIFSMDGKEGLDKALNDNPDLILLDLNLPKIDGIEICKKVRINSDVPIIMVTAKIEELDRLDGLENGADDYITKPFDLNEAVDLVRQALEKQSKTGSPNAAALVEPLSWEQQLENIVQKKLDLGQSEILGEMAPQFERVLLQTALSFTRGRKQEAARRLGWGRNTLTRKLKELQVD